MTKFIIQPHEGSTIGSPTKVFTESVHYELNVAVPCEHAATRFSLSIRRFRSMTTVDFHF
jgi:hypothetical protein